MEKPDENIKLNCWGGVSYKGGTSLHIFVDTLKGEGYRNVVGEHIDEMKDLYPNGFHFIHDNLSVHTSIEAWLRNRNIDVLNFPTYSPDLNIIENVWSTLKDAVRKDCPKTRAEFEASLKVHWEAITTPQALKPYFTNLEKRYRECVAFCGKRLKY